MRPVHRFLIGEEFLPSPEHLLRVVKLWHLLRTLSSQGRFPMLTAEGGNIEAFVEIVEFRDALFYVIGIIADIMQ